MSDTLADRFKGSLLGGAVGDALGASVEFLRLDEIRERYGPDGITDYDEGFGGRGSITDDTQMTLFTAEGLLRHATRRRHHRNTSRADIVHRAYLRWLSTQGEQTLVPVPDVMDGWLITLRALHNRRAPGLTCLSALRSGRIGSARQPLNDSKGCGGVMRVAPIGMLAGDAAEAFQVGCEAAAITHGHPSGYYSAGCFAAIIHLLCRGAALPSAIEQSFALLATEANPRHEECAAAIHQALALAGDRTVTPSPEAVERLGGGWVGEEALAIALYCALHADGSFERGIRLAVNHSGDSDSTGAITGNLLGAILGLEAIPSRWLQELELREEIEAIAADLHTGYEGSERWHSRYPGT